MTTAGRRKQVFPKDYLTRNSNLGYNTTGPKYVERQESTPTNVLPSQASHQELGYPTTMSGHRPNQRTNVDNLNDLETPSKYRSWDNEEDDTQHRGFNKLDIIEPLGADGYPTMMLGPRTNRRTNVDNLNDLPSKHRPWDNEQDDTQHRGFAKLENNVPIETAPKSGHRKTGHPVITTSLRVKRLAAADLADGIAAAHLAAQLAAESAAEYDMPEKFLDGYLGESETVVAAKPKRIKRVYPKSVAFATDQLEKALPTEHLTQKTTNVEPIVGRVVEPGSVASAISNSAETVASAKPKAAEIKTTVKGKRIRQVFPPGFAVNRSEQVKSTKHERPEKVVPTKHEKVLSTKHEHPEQTVRTKHGIPEKVPLIIESSKTVLLTKWGPHPTSRKMTAAELASPICSWTQFETVTTYIRDPKASHPAKQEMVQQEVTKPSKGTGVAKVEGAKNTVTTAQNSKARQPTKQETVQQEATKPSKVNVVTKVEDAKNTRATATFADRKPSKRSEDVTPTTFVCAKKGCGETFDHPKKLHYHAMNTDEHEYCPVHKELFDTFQEFHDHKVHHKEHITCFVCSKDFGSLGGRAIHLAAVSSALSTHHESFLTCSVGAS